VSKPRGWGWKLDVGYMMNLLEEGWGIARQCTSEEAERCGQKLKSGIENEIAMMIDMEKSVDKLLRLTAFRSVKF
jgi:hypothetical protein